MGRAGDRVLRAEGLLNARDLGGLRRRNGSLTPRGVFYRSENVDALTVRGWEQLRAAGIGTIVDLRHPEERARDARGRPGWIGTVEVDLDGEDQDFLTYCRDQGFAGTALFYLPFLETLPERAVAALTAIVSAPPGGVLFHCMGGRDRTGLIALLLLAAAGVEPGGIVADYLETVRLGDRRAAATGRVNPEPELEARCAACGTTTEGAFRAVVDRLDLERVLSAGGARPDVRAALTTWRGSL